MSVFSIFKVPLLEPVNETLEGSHHGNEDDEVVDLDVIEDTRNAQDGGTRGEDWEEVRF